MSKRITSKRKITRRARKRHRHLARQRYLCFYCNALVAGNLITKDHLLPKCRGGGGDANLVKACKPCNMDKASLTLEEYRLVIAFRRGLVPGAVMPFPGEMAS